MALIKQLPVAMYFAILIYISECMQDSGCAAYSGKWVDLCMGADKNSVKEGSHTLPVITIICIVALIFGVFFSIYNIIRNYQRLDEELKLERTVYINEISSRISTSVYNRRDWLISKISGSASMLDFNDVRSYEDIRRLYKDKLEADSTIVLCNDEGRCFDVYGNPFPIQNNSRLSQTLASGKPEYFFEKASNGIDYWVFGSPIEPKQIEDNRFVVILEIYDVEQFQSVLSLELFEDEGIALIINSDGTVNLSPAKDNLKMGYNAIHTLEELGMPEESADTIRRDLTQLTNNRLYTRFMNTSWLIDYNNIQGSQEYVLVLVPIAVTSAGVTQSLRASMLGVGGMITCIATLVLVFVLRSTHLSKIRNKQLYDLQLRSKIVESKNDFLAKMSHDIRTPLNAIIGMNYIAATQVEKDSPAMDSLKKIETAAKYLLSILNDILDMSKIESGKMEIRQVEFSMSGLLASINSIVGIQAEEKGVSFTLSAHKSLGQFYIGDGLRINQILMNLVSNALKFTDKGGHIDVNAEPVEKEGEEKVIRFTVADDGIGMTEGFMQHIFDPFTQDGSEIANQYGGSGLGLSIVKNLVEQMNGHVGVVSKKDVGSTFTVELPLNEAQMADNAGEERPEKLDESRLAGMRILLAEDNELNRIIAKEILQMFDVEVDEAVDGKNALEQFEAKSAGYYAAIITDIRMPVMDGYEMSERIRHSGHPDAQAIPIFAMSANAFDDDVAAASSHGMNAYLKKPIDVDELKATLCACSKAGKEDEL